MFRIAAPPVVASVHDDFIGRQLSPNLRLVNSPVSVSVGTSDEWSAITLFGEGSAVFEAGGAVVDRLWILAQQGEDPPQILLGIDHLLTPEAFGSNSLK